LRSEPTIIKCIILITNSQIAFVVFAVHLRLPEVSTFDKFDSAAMADDQKTTNIHMMTMTTTMALSSNDQEPATIGSLARTLSSAHREPGRLRRLMMRARDVDPSLKYRGSNVDVRARALCA
jgi:hypothetical protein